MSDWNELSVLISLPLTRPVETVSTNRCETISPSVANEWLEERRRGRTSCPLQSRSYLKREKKASLLFNGSSWFARGQSLIKFNDIFWPNCCVILFNSIKTNNFIGSWRTVWSEWNNSDSGRQWGGEKDISKIDVQISKCNKLQRYPWN